MNKIDELVLSGLDWVLNQIDLLKSTNSKNTPANADDALDKHNQLPPLKTEVLVHANFGEKMQMNKFLKIIKKRLDNYKNSNGNCPKLNEVIFELDELVNIAEIQISQSNNGWITVDDKLPELNEDVLVYTGICADYAVAKLVKNDDFYRKNWTAYAKYDYLWVLTESFNDKVLGLMSLVQSMDDAKYWQPLPKPPKE